MLLRIFYQLKMYCKSIILAVISILLIACSKYDDSAIQNELQEIKDRVLKVEQLCKTLNSELSALTIIVNTVNDRDYITNVSELSDKSGYTITFSKRGAIVIKNGLNGETPMIGVDLDNGVYYWTVTINGEKKWLTNALGEKVRAIGIDGVDGIDAKTPIIGVDTDGYWTIDTQDGSGIKRLKDSTGEDIKARGEDGNSFFKSVIVGDEYVTITLNDSQDRPTVFSIPLRKPTTLSINMKTPGTLDLLLTEDQMRSTIKIIITGHINAKDIRTLDDAMLALEDIDLSGTDLQELPNYAFSGGPTTDKDGNVICMNRSKITLKRLILPCQFSEHQSTYRCTNLKSIVAPSAGSSYRAYAPSYSASFTFSNGVTTIFDTQGGNSTYFLNPYCFFIQINIPESVEAIMDNAILAMRGAVIRCYALSPPICSPNSVTANDYNSAILEVPPGTVEIYKRAVCWSQFTNIIEITEKETHKL